MTRDSLSDDTNHRSDNRLAARDPWNHSVPYFQVWLQCRYEYANSGHHFKLVNINTSFCAANMQFIVVTYGMDAKLSANGMIRMVLSVADSS